MGRSMRISGHRLLRVKLPLMMTRMGMKVSFQVSSQMHMD